MYGYTPLMEAAASGHEIIVQYLLNHVSVLAILWVAESLVPALRGTTINLTPYFC